MSAPAYDNTTAAYAPPPQYASPQYAPQQTYAQPPQYAQQQPAQYAAQPQYAVPQQQAMYAQPPSGAPSVMYAQPVAMSAAQVPQTQVIYTTTQNTAAQCPMVKIIQKLAILRIISMKIALKYHESNTNR